MHIYHNEKVDLPKYFRAELYQFMYRTRMIFAQYIHNWYEKFDVGKSPMSFPIYREMCEIMYSLPKTEHVFASLFLIMEQFLIDRGNTCVCSHVNHIDWGDNSLKFYFSQIKTNKEGVDWITPWHVHFNPNNPVIFPVNVLENNLFNIPSNSWAIGNGFLFSPSTKVTQS